MLGLSHPDPAWFHTGPSAQAGLRLTYLGTAGFVLELGGHVIALDPFVTRPGLWSTLFRPLRTDEELLAEVIPVCHEVLVGHAHYDHVLDAPALCRRTGARLLGGPAVRQVGLAAGLPEEQLVVTEGLEDLAAGPFTVRGLPSRHGKVYGRVTLPGDITAPPPWPPRLWHLRHGLVLNWWLEVGGLRVVHVDSADFVEAHLEGLRADVVCLCAIGRHHRPRYLEAVVERLRPRWIVPCHWDTMITPLRAPPELLPGVDLPGFLRDIEAAGVEPMALPLLGSVVIPTG